MKRFNSNYRDWSVDDASFNYAQLLLSWLIKEKAIKHSPTVEHTMNAKKNEW